VLIETFDLFPIDFKDITECFFIYGFALEYLKFVEGSAIPFNKIG
jgi:hypothetical protein